MMNRLMELDLIECLKNYGQVCKIVQEAVTKTIPKKKKCRKEKWLFEEALHKAEEKRKAKNQGRKGKIYPTECRVPETSS